jgi:pimeloyl-ACP methyl ester carboxylesterase
MPQNTGPQDTGPQDTGQTFGANAHTHKPQDAKLRAPGALRLALEARMPWELWSSLMALPLLHSQPRGDGHAVLVFPGLAASDLSTAPLRRYLRDRGYDARSWDLGRNLGPGNGVLEACHAKIRELRQETGRKVSVIGWSLGGIYARETAKLASGDVRQVITLGTPFSGPPKATNAWQVYELASGERIDERAGTFDLKTAPPVPTTSIYSRTDGIVAWQCSVQAPGGQTENIEVEASHIGLGVNPAVLYAIADRLAQPDGQWVPFDKSGLKRMFYGEPTSKDWFPSSCLV